MPLYVLKNSKKGVQDWVVDVDETQIDAHVAAWASEGWSLAKNADPQAVVIDQQAAAATEGN